MKGELIPFKVPVQGEENPEMTCFGVLEDVWEPLLKCIPMHKYENTRTVLHRMGRPHKKQ